MVAKVSIVQVLCRCPQCRAENRVVVDWNMIPKYHKCQSCKELIPLGGYKVIAQTNDLSRPIF
ncbi:hypothetical protein ES708_22448 [subsurface metagenome]